MRLTALVLFGALSIFAVGCANEDTGGSKVLRPSTGAPEHSDDKSETSGTKTTGSTATTGNAAKPLTPDAPVTTTTPTTSTTPTTPATKPVVEAKPIACSTDTDSVTESYRLALQRDPDPGGLQNWVGAIQNGDTRLGVLQKMLQSEEFVSVNANLTDEEFLSFLYHSFFNRDPDAGGLQSWLGALQGGQSRSSVAQAFTNSDEFKDPSSNRAAACYF
jgi:hypothetical protein